MNEAQALVQLQEIDLDLMRTKERQSRLPQLQKIRDVKIAQKNLASDITKIVGQRKDAEIELADNEDETAHVCGLEEEVRADAAQDGHTAREIMNFEAELTHLVKRREKLEYIHQSLLANLEKLQTAETNAHALEKRLQEELAQLLMSCRSEYGELQEKIDGLEARRAEVVRHIDHKNLAWYDDAKKRFGGLAVETLKGNKPSCCRVALQPSDFGDLSRRGAIGECPYCHRILVTGIEEA